MTSFQTASVFFPLGRLNSEFIDVYLELYTVETAAAASLDGELLALSSTNHGSALAAIHKDSPGTIRKASIFDGTIEPLPVYDPPLEPEEDPASRQPNGHTIKCGWPAQFLEDIAAPPLELAEAFEGVRIV